MDIPRDDVGIFVTIIPEDSEHGVLHCASLAGSRIGPPEARVEVVA